MILIEDNIMKETDLCSIRESALASGFGSWQPPTHRFGTGHYKGMNWRGNHAPLHATLYNLMKGPVFPNSSFFRVCTEDTEKRLVHSDQADGRFTAIAYLSDHDEVSGTAFYRHKETGRLTMPTLEEMEADGSTDWWNEQMQDDDKWEQTDFVRGILGRMVIFSAPLFHGRVPYHGIGTDPESARMIWVCHFYGGS